MKKLQENWAKVCWMVGLILFWIGEIVSAFNKAKDDTASETFRDLPEPAKYLIVGGMFATIAHWVWPMPAKIVAALKKDN